MQMNKDPELFCPFLPVSGLNNLPHLTRMKYFGLQGFRDRREKSYIVRVVNIKLVVNAVFFIDGVLPRVT